MFGHHLKEWRQTRHLSQLELALEADVSARHISFLETGRATPSRQMVGHLAEVLDLPMSARNVLLTEAGFAPAHQNLSLDAGAMAPVRAAIDWTLEQHDPFPGLVMDRRWRLVRLNRCGEMLFSGLGLQPGGSLLELLFQPEVRAAVVNWPELALHTARRLRAEAVHYGPDADLDHVRNRLLSDPEVAARDTKGLLPPFVPAIFRQGDTELSLFSTIAAFSSAEDIALADLRIELFFPADDRTRAVLETIVPQGG